MGYHKDNKHEFLFIMVNSNKQPDFRIGIDLGGTKIEIIALDEAGEALFRQRADTPQGDYRTTLEVIHSLVNDTEKQLPGRASIGIGTPGAVSLKTGRIKNANSICLNDQPLQQDLERLLQRPIRLANDANCFALSEATDGAGKGASVVFGVIIGTGTGAGIIVNGHIIGGSNAIAGEWGHNPLPWPQDSERPGPACYCGLRGCIETFLSGPGMVADHRAVNGEALSSHQIVARAAQGDKACEQTLQRYEDRLARGLAHVINILDPDLIVLGGGLSNIDRWYRTVPTLWQDYVFSDHVNTRLCPPRHGDSSGVRGAAWLWND